MIFIIGVVLQTCDNVSRLYDPLHRRVVLFVGEDRFRNNCQSVKPRSENTYSYISICMHNMPYYIYHIYDGRYDAVAIAIDCCALSATPGGVAARIAMGHHRRHRAWGRLRRPEGGHVLFCGALLLVC